MGKRVWGIMGLALALCLAGCASIERQYTPQGWTVPLAAQGLDGQPDRLAEAPAFETRQVSGWADAAPAPTPDAPGTLIADLNGPGAVTRLWSSNPAGSLYIVVDDQPVWGLLWHDVASGQRAPFQPPISAIGETGAYTYVPIPYQRTCQVYIRNNPEPMAYQVTYAQFAPDAVVAPFERRLTSDDAAFFADWARAWNRADAVRLHDPDRETLFHTRRPLWPNQESLLRTIEGSGVITEIEMTIGAAEYGTLDNIWLVIRFDNLAEPAVAAPVSHFFAQATGSNDAQGGLIVGSQGSRMWCRFPMPFTARAEIRLYNDSEYKCDLEYAVVWREETVNSPRYFRATYREANDPGGPITIAAPRGAGHYAGTSIRIDGATTGAIAQTPVSIRTDGNTAFEAGRLIEYFNGGGAGALHAVTAQGDRPGHHIAGYRVHAEAPIAFRGSLVAELSPVAAGGRYAAVSYWYQDGIDGSVGRPSRYPDDFAF